MAGVRARARQVDGAPGRARGGDGSGLGQQQHPAAALALLDREVGGGGLGELITAGMANFNFPQLIAGAVAVALLALGVEIVFAGIERLMTRQLRMGAS